MLEKLIVSHYKSLNDVVINLGRSNIIVGPNGSGKSNLIDCLNFIKDAANEDLDFATTKRHGVESIRQWSKSRPYNITIEMHFKKSKTQFGWYRVVLASSRGGFKVVDESANWHGLSIKISPTSTITTASFKRKESGRVHFNTNVDDDFLNTILRHVDLPTTDLYISQISTRLRNITSAMFEDLIKEINSTSTYSIYPNIIREPQVVTQDEILSTNGSNLASIVKRLNRGTKNNKERLLDSLRFILPIVSDIQVKSTGGYYVPLVRVVEPTGETHDLNMSQLSDGTLRSLGLLTAFYQPSAPKRIALEEPEQMIHPGLLAVLRDAAEDYLSMIEDGQFLVTTHSPQFMDLFKPEDIIWVNFVGGISEVGRIPSRQLSLIKDQLFSAGELLLSEGIGA